MTATSWTSSPWSGGIFADRSELAAQYPNLVIDQHLLIRYPFAEFFVSMSPCWPGDPDRPRACYADGSFMAFFRENPKIREALASANLEQRVHALPNPDMTLAQHSGT